MRNDQILMGVIIAAGCLAGLRQRDWILAQTGWGARFTRWFGARAGIVLRAVLCLGIVFGGLLAANLIRPVQW